MKHSLFILLVGCLAGCREKPEQPHSILHTKGAPLFQPQDTIVYHMRVEQFSHFHQYVINYTKDNWKTKWSVFETFDISNKYDPIEVPLQPMLFDNCDSAVRLAKRFDTYQKVELWNDSVKKECDQLRAKRILYNSDQLKICNPENIY